MKRPRLAGPAGRREGTYAAVVLGFQSFVVLFGAAAAFGLAGSRDEGWQLLGAGCALALACLVVAGMMRRPWGLTAGWLVQAATFAWSLVVPAMVVLAVIFLAMWVVGLVKGRELDERDARLG